MSDKSGCRLEIDGLWALSFGNGIPTQPTGTLFFTAGPDGEAHGSSAGSIRRAGSSDGAGRTV